MSAGLKIRIWNITDRENISMKNNTTIIVCCHKEDPNIRKDNIYFPIHVGKELTNLELGFQGDNTGDNISSKNKNFCELTGLYWAWKNMDSEIIGLAHYRRYLKVDMSNVKSYLSKYDIILPKLNILEMSGADKLMHLTTRDDFYIMLMSLLKLYPQYKDTIISQLFNRNRCSCYNMFICRKRLCDEYCKWLFSIFEDMEHYVRLSKYSRLARLYGFLSEYLLLVYCKQNKLKVKYVDVDLCDVDGCCSMRDPRINTFIKQIKRCIKALSHDVAFRLTHLPKQAIPICPTTTTGFIIDGIPYVDENGKVHDK